MVAETAQALRRLEQPSAELVFGNTPGMREVRTKLECALQDNLPVLIEGESGTGKEVIGRFLHCQSTRREGPFVKINCGAVPARLLEGEIFGDEISLSAGVEATRNGSIDMAWGGTLFLDEIADTDLALQRKLTQTLQAGQNDRLGGGKDPLPRFVCASSTDLEARARQDQAFAGLLECFSYRVRLLPLRERRRDIPQLSEYLAEKFARNFGRPVPHLSQSVLDAFDQWNWPGNIRELENWIARIVIFGSEEALGAEYSRQPGGRFSATVRRHRATYVDFSRMRRTRRRG